MPELLRPTNFDTANLVEITELSSNVAAGQKVANVLNAQGLTDDDFYVIGNLGGELSELAQLDSKSGNALTALANYAQAHKLGDALTKLFGNKIRIYRAANVDGTAPADADFSLISTFDIEVDQSYTEYIDATGGVDFWYKKTYYNSVNLTETDIADSVAVRGGNYGGYATWEEVREEAGLTNNRYIPESVYQEKLLAAQSEVNASLRVGGYTLPLTVVPKLVKNATLLIAAGYVLLKDYGVATTGTNKEGNQKLTQGRLLLKGIEERRDTLTDDAGEDLPTNTTEKINGYPLDSAADNNPSEGVIFRTTDKF